MFVIHAKVNRRAVLLPTSAVNGADICYDSRSSLTSCSTCLTVKDRSKQRSTDFPFPLGNVELHNNKIIKYNNNIIIKYKKC